MRNNDAHDFWSFVNENINVDPARLRLKYHDKELPGIDLDSAITQIECRKRFGKKLAPILAENEHFHFPDTLAGEQCTSPALAQFHASMASEGSHVADLTAGLGIDALYLSQRANVTAVELDPAKAEALSCNSRGRFDVVCDDCRNFIASLPDKSIDTAFIDPYRRDSAGLRVYSLADCSPDVTAMLPELSRVCHKLIVKASPMLDISQTSGLVPQTVKIHVVGTPRECKELIIIADLDKSPAKTHDIDIEAVTLDNDGAKNVFRFTKDEENNTVASYRSPMAGDYLYEPSAVMMKAGAFHLLSQRFGIDKLSTNTHLYVSKDINIDFPGKIYRIADIIPYESKYIKRLYKTIPKAEIAVRNFPIQAETLRKKLMIKEGDQSRIMATTLGDGQYVLVILASKSPSE